MVDAVYKRVAERLDQLPNGFPATSSGVEIKLVQKIFKNHENAVNWLKLSPKPEPIEVIAKRFEKPVAEVQEIVDGLVHHGQINAFKMKEKYHYHIVPFIIGLYEKNFLHGLVDKEYAEYFEEYLPEFSQGYGGFKPAEVRVIPVDESVDAENTIHDYDSARKIIEAGKSFRLLPCVCRFQRKEIGKPCPQNHSVDEGCIVISYVEDDDMTYFPPMARKATKEEALAHLARAAEAGLVHQSYNVEANNHFICNCCSCCCGLLRGANEFKAPYMMVKSNYLAHIDEDLCTACGICADERCQFNAIREEEPFYKVDPECCVGCGVCIETCPAAAIKLELKPEDEQVQPLKSLEEFYQARSLARVE